MSPSNLRNYCAYHAKSMSSVIRLTYKTSFPVRGASTVTLPTHQILRLPRNSEVKIWAGNPLIASAGIKTIRGHPRTSEDNPKIKSSIRTRRFGDLSRPKKIQNFALRLSPKIARNAAPATKFQLLQLRQALHLPRKNESGDLWASIPCIYSLSAFVLSWHLFSVGIHNRLFMRPATRPPGHPATRPPGHPAIRPPGHPAIRPPGRPAARHPAIRPSGNPAILPSGHACDNARVHSATQWTASVHT